MFKLILSQLSVLNFKEIKVLFIIDNVTKTLTKTLIFSNNSLFFSQNVI